MTEENPNQRKAAEVQYWKNLASRAVFSSPHVFVHRSSAQIMWSVSACLLPAALWGVWIYGWLALKILLLSILSCAGTEVLLNIFSNNGNQLYHNRKRKVQWILDDGSAILSGLLLGMNLSPMLPWYLPIFAGIFAMAVCKWSFGGLGANWVNPALAGRAFVFFSFGQEMARWPVPYNVLNNGVLQGFDSSTAASPLGSFKEELLLSHSGTEVGSALQSWGTAMRISPRDSLLNLLLGFQGGSIGEVSAFLLLLGGVALLLLRIISWQIPLAFIGSFVLLTWVFGGLYQDGSFFQGEVLFHLLSGGLMLGAWFMATDYSSCPKMPISKFIFGLGCGLFTFLVRFYGSYPEGVMLAILFMNIWTPTLDILIQPRNFGSGHKAAKRRKVERQNVLNLPSY